MTSSLVELIAGFEGPRDERGLRLVGVGIPLDGPGILDRPGVDSWGSLDIVDEVRAEGRTMGVAGVRNTSGESGMLVKRYNNVVDKDATYLTSALTRRTLMAFV